MDNRQEGLERFAVHADDIRESFKLAFESVKHLTTLSAGTLALFATFLNGIFPKEPGHEIRLLIGSSFAFLILSLVCSAFSLQRIAGLMRSRREYGKKKRRVRWNVLLPALTYIFGLGLFGTAVLLRVFFGAQNLSEEPDKRYIYYALGLLILGVVAWTYYRVSIGNKRDIEGRYEVLYPGVRDYDELVAKQRPVEAFESLQKQIQDEEGLENEHEAQERLKDHSDQGSLPSRQQAYAELLSVTHPYKLAEIGKQVPVDFLEFRDTVNRLDAQMKLLSSTEVQESAKDVVSSFVDCIIAKEEELKVKRGESNSSEESNGINAIRKVLGVQAYWMNTGKKSAEDLNAVYRAKLANLLEARNEFRHATQTDLNVSKYGNRRLRASLQRLKVLGRSNEADV
jgi:hypothetical protein